MTEVGDDRCASVCESARLQFLKHQQNAKIRIQSNAGGKQDVVVAICLYATFTVFVWNLSWSCWFSSPMNSAQLNLNEFYWHDGHACQRCLNGIKRQKSNKFFGKWKQYSRSPSRYVLSLHIRFFNHSVLAQLHFLLHLFPKSSIFHFTWRRKGVNESEQATQRASCGEGHTFEWKSYENATDSSYPLHPWLALGGSLAHYTDYTPGRAAGRWRSPAGLSDNPVDQAPPHLYPSNAFWVIVTSMSPSLETNIRFMFYPATVS